MSKRKPSRKQVGKSKKAGTESSKELRYPVEGETLHTAMMQPMLVLGLKTEAFVEWALPKIEASRSKKKITPTRLDQNQRNLLYGLILEALEPLVQDVRTTDDDLRAINPDHAAPILKPLFTVVRMLEALHEVTDLDAAQKSFAGLALRCARKAEKEVLARSSVEWRAISVPKRAPVGEQLKRELMNAFGVDDETAKEIAAKVLNISANKIK